MSLRAASWFAALLIATAVFVYGASNDGPPRTNADQAHALAQNFACPVCAGQSVAESDVPVAREIRRQIAVWVDEGRTDEFIRDQLVAAYDTEIDYNPAATGFTSLVWILPVVAAAGVVVILTATLRTRLAESHHKRTPSEWSDATKARARGRSEGAQSHGRTKKMPAHSQPEMAPARGRGDGAQARGRTEMVRARGRGDGARARGRTEKVLAHGQTEGARAHNQTGKARSYGHAEGGGRRWRTTAAWTVSVVLVATAAGVLVARFSGSRGADGSITGDIRVTTRQLIFEAQSAFSGGDMAGAIELYDEALALSPSNAEALAYRGWLTSRNGDHATAVEYLDDAIAIDPEYPDARLFRAIVALDQNDTPRATSELAMFDSLDPPPFAESLIARARIRERVAVAADTAAVDKVLAVWQSADRPSFVAAELVVDDALLAAESLAAEGELLEGLRLLDWVLDDRPDDPDVLAGRGWMIARTGEPELIDRGIQHLDAALAVDPDHASALVYRAFTSHQRGDDAAARADLAAFDALNDRPSELTELVDAYGLRVALSQETE